jgi:hypothetical protein
MEAESPQVVPPTDLGAESAPADTEYDETREDVETQEAQLAPVDERAEDFDPQQQPARPGPIKLLATPDESETEEGGQ